MKYSVVVHKDPSSDFGVTVPDLPGCFSAGSTFDEALANAREAIACHIEGLLIDGERVATPQPVDEHTKNPDFGGGTWAIIETEFPQDAVRTALCLSLPDHLVYEIDSYAKKKGATRDTILAEAAVEYLASRPD